MADTPLDPSIVAQLNDAVTLGISRIFNEVTTLIQDTFQQANSKDTKINFGQLDQQILDKFTLYRAVLEQLCQAPGLNKHAVDYLKLCFRLVKRVFEKRNQEWQKDYSSYAESYDIKCPDWTVYTPKRQDNIFSDKKLQQGAMLAEVKEKLYVNWVDYLKQQTKDIRLNSAAEKQQQLVNTLFECLCVSLIFDQGCIQPERLIAIHDAIFQMNLDSGLLPVYSKRKNVYVFSYTLPSTKYGNIYRQHGEEEAELWQTQHIYFNAFVMLCYQRIKGLLNGPQGYVLQNTSPLECWRKDRSETETEIQPETLLLEKLKIHFNIVLNMGEEKGSEKALEDPPFVQPDHMKLFLKDFEKTGFAIFKHMDYVLWQRTPLDVLSTSVLNDRIITSPLSYEQHTQLYDRLDPWETIEARIKSGMMYQVLDLQDPTPPQMFRDRRTGKRHDLKSWLLSFHQDMTPKKLAEQLETAITKSGDYKTTYEDGDGEYLDYVVAIANLRICEWLKEEFNYQIKKGKSAIEVSTIKRYYSSFVLDMLCYVLEQQINLETATEDQFEEMYCNIVEEKLLNDQENQKKNAKTNNNKKHTTSGYAFDRLKAFHQYLVKKHRAPIVQYLYERQSDNLFLKTRLISPQMFQLMIRILREYPGALGLTEQDATALEWVYTLAFRLGLRIDEAAGICIDDFVPAQLQKHPDNRQLYYQLKTNQDDPSAQNESSIPNAINDLILKIRLNSERSLKSDNATRQFDLAYFLAPEEFIGFCRFYQGMLPNSKMAAASSKRKTKQLFMLGEGALSSSNLSKITYQLFNAVLGTNDHPYTFHAFRHSAASHLAILLKGSKDLVICFTDYYSESTSEFGRKLKKHILPMIKDASSRSSVVWLRLAHLMGHEDIRTTARHYLHHLDILIADTFYQANREYSPQLIKALLGDSQLMRRDFKIEFQSNERDILKAIKKSNQFKENSSQADLLKNKKKQNPPKQQDVFLYCENFLDNYLKWQQDKDKAKIDPKVFKFIESISKPYSLYKSNMKNEPNYEDIISSTWKKMVKWSTDYNIDQPFQLNKGATQKYLDHFFCCLENKISLVKDRPILTFKVSCKKDQDAYTKFIDCIAEIYPDYKEYLEWNLHDPEEYDNLRKGEEKIKKYEIRNKKTARDNKFIQKMLLQSVFYKMR